MNTSEIQHTKAIFEHLLDDLPPGVPLEIKENIAHAQEQAENNVTLGIESLEDTMVYVGKLLWPYREAFQEFYRVYEGQLGEQYLLKKFSLPMKKKFAAFQKEGGTFRDLHRGANITFFTSEERVKLCEALVAVEKELRAFTIQSVLSSEQKRYQKRVQEFVQIYHEMEERLEGLRMMAEREGEHPELAAEIKDQIRAFEHGFALLGPKVCHEAVCQAEEHFEGRKKIRNHRRRK